MLFWGGGFKGQVRWPKGPPHLALNPPYFFLFFCCLCFPFFVFNRKTLFSHEKGHFCLFICVSLCFALAFFGPPPSSLSLFVPSLVLVFLPSFLFLISASGSCFVFCFVCFLFQAVLLFLFFCLLSFLNHNI